MSLDCAILGFLSKAPATGYDIKNRCFAGEIAAFWPADQAQIYRTLKKLELNKEVKVRRVGSQIRPGRNVYSLTAAGKSRFDEWMTSTEKPPAMRDPFALKLYFSDELSKDELKESYVHQKAELKARLEQINEWLVGDDAPQQAGKTRALHKVKSSLEASIKNCDREIKALSRTAIQGSKR